MDSGYGTVSDQGCCRGEAGHSGHETGVGIGQAQDRGGHALTLPYVLNRKKLFNFDFCYGGLCHHPTIFDLKLCKLPTSERRAAMKATVTTPLRTRQYVWTPTYVPGCCIETGKLPQIICSI